MPERKRDNTHYNELDEITFHKIQKCNGWNLEMDNVILSNSLLWV